MSEKEKVLNEIHGLLQPYRLKATEVNFRHFEKKERGKDERINVHQLEIVGSDFIIKVQVL